jgi:diguanylate cyclase (GGDEF)-like protein
VLDIQELRAVNDSYGYETGDQLLVGIATQLQRTLASHEHVARLGGDQFALCLDPRAHALHDGALEENITRWIDQVAARASEETGYRIDLGVWTGIARAHPNDTPAEVVRRAGVAANTARQRPIARTLVYDRELDTQIRERARLTRALHRAIERDEFVLDYQPNVRMGDGTIVSAEALIRWDDPEYGRQMPASFIPVAQQSRLIVPLGEWSVRTACRQIRHWQDRGFNTGIAVNVSRVHFAHADVAAYVADTVEQTGIDPARLTIEVTESAFEQHTDHLLDQLDRLKDHGIRLALDDFGTGYSSLKYLQQCPFDVIKVDMRFIQRVGVDRYSHDVVQVVKFLADSLGAQVIAEGVETDAQRAELLKLDCLFGQGYHFAHPMPAETLEGLLLQKTTLPPPAVISPKDSA